MTESAEGPPIRRLGYQPALDGVRAFAVMAVITHHTLIVQDWPPGGSLGVTTFFVASGFLITVLLLQERGTRGRISLTRFYRRRALRLMPALVVFVAAVLAYSLVVSLAQSPAAWSEFQDIAFGAFAGVFYFTNIAIGYDVGAAIPIETSHLWTLATEEQFYLLWPPLLALAVRRKVGDKWLAVALGALVVVLAANRFALSFDGAPVPRVKYAPDATFDSILLGCLAGLLFVNNWLPVRSPRKVGALGALAAVACAAMILLPSSNAVQFGVLVPAYSIAALVVVLAAVTVPRSLVNRGLSAKPLVFIGRISYSLFLWQQLFIFGIAPRIGTVVGAIALAFVTSCVSYWFVERRFLELKRRDRAELEGQASGLESAPAEDVTVKRPVPSRGARFRLDDGRVITISRSSARAGFTPALDGAKTIVCARCSRTQAAGSWTALRLSRHTRDALDEVNLLASDICRDCREPTPVAA